MNYNILLDMVSELGYQLAMCGAETYRVEESIMRVLATYEVSGEVFAIPNCMIVTLETSDGQSMTRMRRIGHHGSNMEGVEQLISLSRKICACTPDPDDALNWIHAEQKTRKQYALAFCLLGSFLGGCGYAIFFGGSFIDSLCSGVCGILICLVNYYLGKLNVNMFFSTIAAAFIMAFSAYTMGALGIADNTGPVIIGALMSLVPGWLFTNAMRDIIFGDTNSGINRIVQVFLIAAALALGTGAAWSLVSALFTVPVMPEAASNPGWVNCLAAFLGCLGFLFTFNIHGNGGILCALGGALGWAVWEIANITLHNEIVAYFIAALFTALYSEIMARIRKYPAISYQVISMFPLIPGAGIYYTTNYLVLGDMAGFLHKGRLTISTAGVLAVGILLVSTTARFLSLHKHNQHKT